MKILITDDSSDTREVLTSVISQEGYEVESLPSGQSLLDRIHDIDSAVILLDWSMPGLDGINVCKRIRGMNRQGSFYIIMRSSREESDHISRALKAGANDYILTITDPVELKARLGVGIRTVKLEMELRELNQRFKRLAKTDSLTELLNHAAILGELDMELDRGRRDSSSTSVLMLDLDKFKAINDTYGHQTGDMILTRLAGLMKSSCRSFDRIGRYGGEEFLIVLPRTGNTEALAIGERIRIAVLEMNLDDIVEELSITCSVGVCSASGSLQHSSSLVAAADSALFRAKRAGRNTVRSCSRGRSEA